VDFDLTEDQKEIKRVAHELLANRSPWAKVRQAAEAGEYDQGLWRELVELGWPGIAVSEEHSGQGLGMVELAVLAEELGYACAAVPLVPAGAVAATISACASQEARARLLPSLVAGERRGGFGTAGLAADAAGADVVVLLSDGEEAELVERPEAERFATIDSTRRYATVAGGGGSREPLEAGAADRIRVVLAAEVLGLCQRALEMTLEYVITSRTAGNSASPSAPSRPSRTAARRCCCTPRRCARRPTSRPGPPTLIPSASPRRQRWPRPLPPRAAGTSPPARSRPTVASASPGKRTSTGSTSVRSWTPRCWVASDAIARPWRDTRRRG